MRRRIWATVLELNVQLSVDAATTALIGLSEYDTGPPCNLDDEVLDRATTTLPPLQPRDCFTTLSLQILILQPFPSRLRLNEPSTSVHTEAML